LLYKYKNISSNDASQRHLYKLIYEELNAINSFKNYKISLFLYALSQEYPSTIYEQNQKTVSQIRLKHLENNHSLAQNDIFKLTNI